MEQKETMSSNELKKRMLLHNLAAKTTKTNNEGHDNLAVYATVVCSCPKMEDGWMVRRDCPTRMEVGMLPEPHPRKQG